MFLSHFVCDAGRIKEMVSDSNVECKNTINKEKNVVYNVK